jgi:hypothetical protein
LNGSGSTKRLAVFAVMILAATGVRVRADPIPPEWLEEQHASCVFTCRQSPANDPKDCESACTCAGKEMSALLTREEYIAIERTEQQQKKLAVDLAEKLRTINDRCTPDPSGL